MSTIKLSIILLFVTRMENSVVLGIEDDPCNPQLFEENSEDVMGNCSLRNFDRHLLCSGGLHGEWIADPESIRALTLCEWPQTFFDPDKVLKRFKNLKKFTLARSDVAELSSSFPFEVDLLEEIILTDTKIEQIRADAFINLNRLQTLDLRKNALTAINPRIIEPSHLERIYLSENPWTCNENVSWILDRGNHSVEKKIIDKEQMSCGSPYEGRPLVSVIEIIITLREECKRTVCDCELVYVVGRFGRQRPKQSMMAFATANCSYRGLTEMPEFLPANTTTLHLKGNQISDLTPLATNPVYKQVIDLYVDENFIESITHLEGSYWLDHFRVLSLRSNRLTDLPTYALENVLLQSDSVVSIYLGDNPWRCDCLFTPGFQDLLIRYTNLVKDVNDVRCNSAVNEENLHKQIRDLTRTEICIAPSSFSWLHPLDVLNFILASLIVLIVGKLLYDYWSFKRTGKLPWIVAKIP